MKRHMKSQRGLRVRLSGGSSAPRAQAPTTERRTSSRKARLAERRSLHQESRSSWRLLQGYALGVAAFSLTGCSLLPAPGPAAGAAPAPEPLLRIQGQQLDGPQAYAIGKVALGAGDLQRALLHFEKALSISPQMADAENGRVVALARLGRIDEAIMLGQRAIALGTSSAELHGNLGLLLDERGDSRRAAIHLARAAQLDPSNPAWQRWTMAAAVSAPVKAAAPVAAAPVTPATAVPPAQALPATAQPAAVVALAGGSRLSQVPLASAPSTSEPAIAAGVGTESLRWVQQAPNVLTLSSVVPAGKTDNVGLADASPSASPPAIVVLGTTPAAVTAAARQTPTVVTADAAAPAATAAPAVTPAPLPRSALAATPATVLEASLTVLSRIEISNGHGRKGLARDMASGLQSVMSGPARVTNHSHFRVLQTEVQYRSVEELGAAKTLARSLGVPEERIVMNTRLRESAPVRLLLGRDAPDTREAITDTLVRARRSILAGAPQT